MMGLISRMMGGSHETECDCDQSSKISTDDEKVDNLVAKINIEDQPPTVDNDGQEQPNIEHVIESLHIVKHNLTKYDNDCKNQSSSNYDSTDSNGHRKAKRKPRKLPSREVLQRVSELLEYYLSDENLVKDMFLLKHVTKHKEGYVSLKLLANYKKLKRVRKEWTVLVLALKNSTKLEINSDGTKIRRREKLPSELEEDTRLFRSVLGYAIPEEFANMEKLAEIFSKFGEVASIQLHKPGGRYLPEVHLADKENPGLVDSICSLIIYDRVYCARLALKHFSSNTECPLKVMAVPRQKILSTGGRLDVSQTPKEYESSYFSASDLEDRGSPFVFRSRNISHVSPSTAISNNWRTRCFSNGSTTSSPRSPGSLTHLGTSIICSSNEAKCSSSMSNFSDMQIRMKYQVTPNSSPLPRRCIPGRPMATPPDSPAAIRRFTSHLQAVSAPDSPWGRRKVFLPRMDNMDSNTTRSREAFFPENIIRMPKGPDNTKGFRTRSEIAGLEA